MKNNENYFPVNSSNDRTLIRNRDPKKYQL